MDKARDYKNFRQGQIYHVYNRGNNKQTIFHDHQDYLVFLIRIKFILSIVDSKDKNYQTRMKPLPPKSMTMLSYCLMPNHFHFLLKQEGDVNIATFMRKLCTSYAKYHNLKYQYIGNVWQDIFKAKRVDYDPYLKQLLRYIIQNPFSFIDYPYSSINELLHDRQSSITNFREVFRLTGLRRAAFIKFVVDRADPADLKNIQNYMLD